MSHIRTDHSSSRKETPQKLVCKRRCFKGDYWDHWLKEFRAAASEEEIKNGKEQGKGFPVFMSSLSVLLKHLPTFACYSDKIKTFFK